MIPFCALWLVLLGMLSPTAALTLSAQTAPKLVSVTPADGATQVPTTSALVFVFDQAMDTSVPAIPSTTGFTGSLDVTAPGFNQTLVGEWGADGKTLTVKPAIQFPYATFTWTLNPPGAFTFFRIKSKAGGVLATISGTFTTGVGGGDPTLGSSSPANGATGVRVDAQVEFKFAQVMKKDTALSGAIAWTGTGLDASKFTYSWSTDGRSLFCDYAGDFPGFTLIGWALNPAAATVKLQSEAGKAIPANTYSGLFTTGSSTPPCELGGLPDGWGSYGIFKRSDFRQSSPADPVPDTEESSFVFSVLVSSPSQGGTVTAGSVTRPSGAKDDLLALGPIAQYYENAASEAALNTAFPAGTYTLRFSRTGAADQAIPMTMPASAPPIPKIANQAEAQAVNPAAAFTLRWNAFTGAGTDDHISLYVSDSNGNVLFQAPDLCVPRELPATATSVVIPANTLQVGVTYNAAIMFGRQFYHSTNAVPLMSGFADLIRNTYFTIKTSGGTVTPAVPATLGGYVLLPNGNPQFHLAGTIGRAYSIQRTGNLGAPAWQTVGSVTMDAAGNAVFEDAQGGKTFPLFYRVVAD